MQDYEKLADLIGDIHEAATEPELWSDVVAKIRDFVGGEACVLISKDTTSKFGKFLYQVGFDPHYIETYQKTYAEFDPISTLPRVGQVMSIPDFVPYDEFRHGPFIQEYMRPQGWVDSAIVALEKSDPDHAIFLITNPRKKSGMVDDELRRRLALIAPHARRALLVGKAVDLQQSTAVALTETLNALDAGTFLVDGDGQIVHANAAGHAMLYDADLVRSADDRLAVCNSWVDQTLRQVLAACTGGEMRIAATGLTLPLTARNGERYVVHVLPLTSSARQCKPRLRRYRRRICAQRTAPFPLKAIALTAVGRSHDTRLRASVPENGTKETSARNCVGRWQPLRARAFIGSNHVARICHLQLHRGKMIGSLYNPIPFTVQGKIDAPLMAIDVGKCAQLAIVIHHCGEICHVNGNFMVDRDLIVERPCLEGLPDQSGIPAFVFTQQDLGQSSRVGNPHAAMAVGTLSHLKHEFILLHRIVHKYGVLAGKRELEVSHHILWAVWLDNIVFPNIGRGPVYPPPIDQPPILRMNFHRPFMH